jgi:endonuclease G
LFATGLAVGIGAGVLYPRKSTKEVFVPPPPPEGNYRGTPAKIVTPTGGVALQGGFPGEFHCVMRFSYRRRVIDEDLRVGVWWV